MDRALREFTIEPIKTTVALHRRLMRNGAFLRSETDINFVERLLGK
jgi:acetyl-CoA carboxylase biotin carboxylase subunit